MELTKKIKNLIQSSPTPLTLTDIMQSLDIPVDETQNVQEILIHLEISGEIYLNDFQEYTAFPANLGLTVGEFRYDNRNRPFVLSGQAMLYIPGDQLKGALRGDIVVVKRNSFSQMGEQKSTIEKIIKRQNNLFVFECVQKEGTKAIRPYLQPFPFQVTLEPSDFNPLQIGDRFLLAIGTQSTQQAFPGKMVCLIGHQNDPYLDIKTIAACHGIKTEFSQEVLEEAEQIPDQISEEEIISEKENARVDLRDKMIFTIDGKHAKDLDDAISLEKNEKGNYVLGVHIADVSYYVKEGSAIQKEALLRGHSYYFLNIVIPMLPKKLSNGICSLNPNVDRFTKSCFIEIDTQGNILSYHIQNSIIRSRKKMSYEEVNQIFDAHQMVEGYEEFIPYLQEMYQLSSILDKQKHQRGYICFQVDEIQIDTNQFGFPTHLSTRKKGSSEKLIENFMLLANEVIGDYPEKLNLQQEHLPYIYRIHDHPNKERLKDVLSYLQQMGYQLEDTDYNQSKNFQQLIEKLSNLDAYPALSDMLIKGLSKAKYSIHNIGHFGLALPHYTHFTSPIRRYSDLQTHYNMNHYSSPTRLLLNSEEEQEKMMQICKHISDVEKIANATEDEIMNYKLAQFMEDKLGQNFTCMINHIGKNHVLIRTVEGVTGTIDLEDFIQMGYVLQNNVLINVQEKTSLRLGDIISVYLIEANLDTKKIRFSMMNTPQKIYQKTSA